MPRTVAIGGSIMRTYTYTANSANPNSINNGAKRLVLLDNDHFSFPSTTISDTATITKIIIDYKLNGSPSRTYHFKVGLVNRKNWKPENSTYPQADKIAYISNSTTQDGALTSSTKTITNSFTNASYSYYGKTAADSTLKSYTIPGKFTVSDWKQLLTDGCSIIFLACDNEVGFNPAANVRLGNYLNSVDQDGTTHQNQNDITLFARSIVLTITTDESDSETPSTPEIVDTTPTFSITNMSLKNNQSNLTLYLKVTGVNIPDDTWVTITMSGNISATIANNSTNHTTFGELKNGKEISFTITPYTNTQAYGYTVSISILSASDSKSGTSIAYSSSTATHDTNLHLAGSGYGVGIGIYSTGTQSAPRFDCAYPAYFPNGISLGGSTIQTNWPSGGSSSYPTNPTFTSITLGGKTLTSWPSTNLKFAQGTITGWSTTNDEGKIIDYANAGFTLAPYIGLTIRYDGSNSTWDGHMRLKNISTTSVEAWSHLIQKTTDSSVTFTVDWFAIGT